LSPELFLLSILAPIGLLTTAYVLWPLLRNPSAPDGNDSGQATQLNREIVRERRAQLDRELALLPADSPERDRLILEFSSAALLDLEAPSPRSRRAEPSRWVIAALLAGLLSVGPLAFYRQTGTPEAASPDFARQAQPQDLATLVTELERRLQADPQAADGWLLLGRSKLSLGDLAGATAAMERALAIDSPLPGLAAQIRVDLADVLAQAASSRLTGRPWLLIQEALERDAGNQKALALAGAYQVTQGDPAAALTYWEPLLAQLPPGSEQQAQIASFVEDLKAGRNPGSGTGNATPPPAVPAASGPVLRGRVEIAAELLANARPDDALFIAVRGVDQDGRPAGPPAAVLRARAADLPLDFELSDREAMSPAAKLSGQTRVLVVARISRAGTAAGGAGDLEGRSPIVAPDAQSVQVRIDRVLP
jgi:cytochrome c-type biogenesis protein CcmH